MALIAALPPAVLAAFLFRLGRFVGVNQKFGYSWVDPYESEGIAHKEHTTQ
jgi:hypothetical protein